jgi:dihydropteroate synthase
MPSTARPWTHRGLLLAGDGRPRVMGILNVTPDSFSDGGNYPTPEAALARARLLVFDGAEILDVGGESSRPGATPVPLHLELRRVLPAIEALAPLGVPISVDTVKPEVARRAVAAGARIINDISGLRDPAMIAAVAETGAAVVLMHMAGTPRTMQVDPRYDDVVAEVRDYLARQLDAAAAAGIPRERIALDPGIGFGKTHEHNVALLRHLDRFASLGCALLVGTSRKGFLGQITGRPRHERAAATAASSLVAAANGADVLRVHDVAPTVDVLKVWDALHGWDGRP